VNFKLIFIVIVSLAPLRPTLQELRNQLTKLLCTHTYAGNVDTANQDMW
ncbi:uncharacterized protein METZ01_LOCUS374260, partial [marine metagenome]